MDYCDMDGLPISMTDFLETYHAETRIIAVDVIGEVTLSTVFLGFAHKPFETAVITPTDTEVLKTHKTFGEALAYHQKLLDSWLRMYYPKQVDRSIRHPSIPNSSPSFIIET